MTNCEAQMTNPLSAIKSFAIPTLPLPLLMAGVGADDVNTTLAPHNLTVLANPLDACPNLHGAPPLPLIESESV